MRGLLNPADRSPVSADLIPAAGPIQFRHDESEIQCTPDYPDRMRRTAEPDHSDFLQILVFLYKMKEQGFKIGSGHVG